jgi:hypothetical protein
MLQLQNKSSVSENAINLNLIFKLSRIRENTYQQHYNRLFINEAQLLDNLRFIPYILFNKKN